MSNSARNGNRILKKRFTFTAGRCKTSDHIALNTKLLTRAVISLMVMDGQQSHGWNKLVTYSNTIP